MFYDYVGLEKNLQNPQILLWIQLFHLITLSLHERNIRLFLKKELYTYGIYFMANDKGNKCRVFLSPATYRHMCFKGTNSFQALLQR